MKKRKSTSDLVLVKSTRRQSQRGRLLSPTYPQDRQSPCGEDPNFGGSNATKMELRQKIQISTAHLTKVLIVFLALLLDFAEAGRQSKGVKGILQLPRFSHDHLNNHTVRVGNEVQFSCTVEHLGKFKVAWLHSEKGTLAVYPIVVTQNDRMSVSFDNRATYHLKLQNIQESDAGKYICQINTGPVISIGGTLSVVVPPDIIDDESSSDTLATEGMRVLLNCRARVDVHHGSDLELRQVSRFDSGEYLCLANNGIPPMVSKRVRLYVDFSPTLWISHQRVGAQIGSTAILECLTAAYPPSLNFWSKDGNEVITEKSGKFELVQISGKPRFYNIQMKIRIRNVTQNDFGTYRCSARNPQGISDGEIKLYESIDMEQDTTAVILLEDKDPISVERNRHKKHRKTRKRHRNKEDYLSDLDPEEENGEGILRSYGVDQGYHHSGWI
eukprot:maker-scaffold10_size831480-snap-gene-4.14 protein:Tk01830 transcript:maker-scaffold10_size831480-snap-gene-4.14-mRNA-1 annotation:"neurotrimin-like isoform x3"